MRLLVLPLMLCCFSAAAGEGPPSWQVALPKAESWQVAHKQERHPEYIVEYTQGGEDINAWSQLVTFMYMKIPSGRFQDYVNLNLIKLQKDCPSFKAILIEKTDVKVIFRWSHEGCKGYPAQEVIARSDSVDSGVLNLQYAYIKGKATPDLDAWVKRVAGARVKH